MLPRYLKLNKYCLTLRVCISAMRKYFKHSKLTILRPDNTKNSLQQRVDKYFTYIEISARIYFLSYFRFWNAMKLTLYWNVTRGYMRSWQRIPTWRAFWMTHMRSFSCNSLYPRHKISLKRFTHLVVAVLHLWRRNLFLQNIRVYIRYMDPRKMISVDLR